MKKILSMVVIVVALTILFKVIYTLSGSNKLDNYLPFFLTSDGWNKYEREANSPEKLAELANPAAVMCIKAGGSVQKTTSAKGENSNCVFVNGEKCEQWMLFRGECNISGVSKTVKYGAYDEEAALVIYRIFNNTAVLNVPRAGLIDITLELTNSASGARYISKDRKIESWEHQGELMVFLDGKQVFVGKEMNDSMNFSPTEKYEGKDANKQKVTLDFGADNEKNMYRLTTAEGSIYREFNYERGWNNDDNATVYVLNWKNSSNEQRIFVKKSNTNTLVELNSKREEMIPQTIFDLTKIQ